jgi:ABC-2 type transport system permease protein
MKSLRRIAAIAFKEFKQLSRDRMTFGMIVMIPVIQLMLFGYAINTNVRDIPAAVVDFSNSQHSRSITQAMQASQVIKFVDAYHDVESAEKALTRGDVRAVLLIPHDLAQRAASWTQTDSKAHRPLAQWLVDGSDTMIARALSQFRQMPAQALIGRVQRSNRQATAIEVALYFNPEQRTAVNIVPGIVAIILTMTMVMFTSAAIVRERERGNLEFLIATPVHPLELMLGKIAPYIVAGLIQTTLILTLGRYVFNVHIVGDLLTLALASLLFIFANLSLGLLFSTIAQAQLQAMQMTIFVMLPSILLSGFMFPYEGMPAAAQAIAEVLPATHFMRMVRGIVLRDAAFTDLDDDAVWLALFTFAMLVLSAMRFKKRLD